MIMHCGNVGGGCDGQEQEATSGTCILFAHSDVRALFGSELGASINRD